MNHGQKTILESKSGGHVTQQDISDLLASYGELTESEIVELIASGKVGGHIPQPKKQGNLWWCHIHRDWIN